MLARGRPGKFEVFFLSIATSVWDILHSWAPKGVFLKKKKRKLKKTRHFMGCIYMLVLQYRGDWRLGRVLAAADQSLPRRSSLRCGGINTIGLFDDANMGNLYAKTARAKTEMLKTDC